MTTPLRILVVDDARDMRMLVRRVLAPRIALEVVGEADCAAEALAQFRSLSPDAIVLDYQMPDDNGLSVARTILAETPGVGIVLFTAYLSEEIREVADQLGIRSCLSKDQLFQLPEQLEALVS